MLTEFSVFFFQTKGRNTYGPEVSWARNSAKEDFIYPLTAEEEKAVTVQIEKIQPQPTQKGEFAGQMKIFLKNDLLFSQNLYMI